LPLAWRMVRKGVDGTAHFFGRLAEIGHLLLVSFAAPPDLYGLHTDYPILGVPPSLRHCMHMVALGTDWNKRSCPLTR
jgi:hypothetical protein